jgi:hypothetical protein
VPGLAANECAGHPAAFESPALLMEDEPARVLAPAGIRVAGNSAGFECPVLFGEQTRRGAGAVSKTAGRIRAADRARCSPHTDGEPAKGRDLRHVLATTQPVEGATLIKR